MNHVDEVRSPAPRGPSRRDLLRGAALVSGAAVAGGLALGVAREAPAGADTAIGAINARPAIVAAGQPFVGALGDSITIIGVTAGVSGELGSGLAVFGPRSYLGWALAQTGGRFRFGGVWATRGYTSAQILTTHLPSALASSVEVVAILAGTNDIGALTLEQSQANIVSMVTQLQANGQTPVLSTIPPYNSTSGAELTQLTSFNSWIRQYAVQSGLALADYHVALAYPTTTLYVPAYDSGDGIHPNNKGAYEMGATLAAALDAVPGTQAPMLLSGYTPTALLKDATFVGRQGSDAATWVATGSTSRGGYSEVTGAWAGYMGVITRGSAGDYVLTGRCSPPQAGHRLSLSFVLGSAVPNGGTWSVAFEDTTTSKIICGYAGMDGGIADGLSNWEFVVPQGLDTTHTYAIRSYVQGEPGVTLGLAQVSLEDLSVAR